MPSACCAPAARIISLNALAGMIGDWEYVTEVENCELVYGFGNLLLTK